MLCKDCKHFHIRCEYEDEYRWGEAVCDKHDLITEFRTKKKFKTLKCVEEDDGGNYERQSNDDVRSHPRIR